MYKLGLEKRGMRNQIDNIRWIIKKAREFWKNIYLCVINDTKAFDCVNYNKLWKVLKRWEYQTILPVSWETCMQIKKQQLESCMEQLIGSWLREEYARDVSCHPVYLTYMPSTSREMPWNVGWITNWNQDRQEKHQQPQICGWYHSNGRKQRGTKELLDEGKGGKWKSLLKTKY